jgi:hypothetical protein
MSTGSGARWIGALVLSAVFATSTSAAAATRCDRLLLRLAHQVTDVDCFESTDLTTNNPATTPADNSLSPPLPVFALPFGLAALLMFRFVRITLASRR